MSFYITAIACYYRIVNLLLKCSSPRVLADAASLADAMAGERAECMYASGGWSV